MTPVRSASSPAGWRAGWRGSRSHLLGYPCCPTYIAKRPCRPPSRRARYRRREDLLVLAPLPHVSVYQPEAVANEPETARPVSSPAWQPVHWTKCRLDGACDLRFATGVWADTTARGYHPP